MSRSASRLPRSARRLAATAVAGALLAGGVAACGQGDGGDGDYTVRAIFDSATFVIPGLDVRVAGASVGTVADVELTPENQAAVTLAITEPGFQDFRQDASCTIRPQALIGERYVQCDMTQPRPAGATAPGPLARIAEGEHEGQYLLPVDQTSVPVDPDQVLQTNDASTRERFAIILRELGAGVAGRGDKINAALRKSNPALREANKLLKQLDAQQETLKRLTETSDQALAVLASERSSISGTITNGNVVMNRFSSRRTELRDTITQLDSLLGEVPTSVDRLTELTDELQPIASDLASSADDMAVVINGLPTLARRSTTAIETLGPVLDQGRDVLVENQPFWDRIVRTSAATRESLGVLGMTLGDFRNTGGLDYFLDAIWGLAFATNGRDAGGSFLRAAGVNLLGCAIPDQGASRTNCGTFTLETEASQASEASGARAGAASRAQTIPSSVKATTLDADQATTPSSRSDATGTTPDADDATPATTPEVDEATERAAADLLLGGGR